MYILFHLFSKKNNNIKTLINSGIEVNILSFTYALKLDF